MSNPKRATLAAVLVLACAALLARDATAQSINLLGQGAGNAISAREYAQVRVYGVYCQVQGPLRCIISKGPRVWDGYTHMAFGPGTWQECRQWMTARGLS